MQFVLRLHTCRKIWLVQRINEECNETACEIFTTLDELEKRSRKCTVFSSTLLCLLCHAGTFTFRFNLSHILPTRKWLKGVVQSRHGREKKTFSIEVNEWLRFENINWKDNIEVYNHSLNFRRALLYILLNSQRSLPRSMCQNSSC